MEDDEFYQAEHFYNDDVAGAESESSDDDAEDLSKLGYFELAKRFLGKRELPKLEADTSNFPDICKNIYVQVRLIVLFLQIHFQVSEITHMQDHEVAAIRQSNGPIRVRGKNCPRPILNFAQAGLPAVIQRYLAKRDIVKPFPIQMQAIPALLCGRDCICVAETGSGKTLAFLLPLLKHVMAQPTLARGEGPIGLIIAPTRELALQTHKQLVPLAELLGIRSVCAYGGAPVGEQLSRLKAQCEILVATPGRLIDVLTASRGKITNLRRVSFLVLDEADRMFDMGFEPQVAMVLAGLNPKRQLCMFSATFPPHIEGLARKSLQKPVEIVVGGNEGVSSNIEQNVVVVSSDSDRLQQLLKLLGEWAEHGSVLVFAQTKDEVDSLYGQLLKFGYSCLTLHGGQDQFDRDSTISDFKKRKPPNILIATSVAARGLDVPDCVLVVNYRVPEHLEDYVHRIGRTGRAGKAGFAYTFISGAEADKAQDLIEALKSGGQKVPQLLIELALQHQAQISLGLAKKKSKWSGFAGGSGFKFDASEKSGIQRAKTERDEDASVTPPVSAVVPSAAPVGKGPAPPSGPPPPRGPPPSRPSGPPPPPPFAYPGAMVAASSSSAGAIVQSTGPVGASSYLMTKLGGVVPVPPAPRGALVEEFEINEYPEAARLKGLPRDLRIQLEEKLNVRIQTKGQYIAPKAVVPPGARKLFIEISGPNRNNLIRARKEVFDAIEEVAIKSLNIAPERLLPRKKRRIG